MIDVFQESAILWSIVQLLEKGTPHPKHLSFTLEDLERDMGVEESLDKTKGLFV